MSLNKFQAFYNLVCFVKPYFFDRLVNAEIQETGYFDCFIVIYKDLQNKIINDFLLIVFVCGVAFDKFGNKRKYLLFRNFPPAL